MSDARYLNVVELDRLPIGQEIIDRLGDHAVKVPGGLWRYPETVDMTGHRVVRYGPFIIVDDPTSVPADAALACPACGSISPLIVQPPCSLDQYDPDPWHRAATHTPTPGAEPHQPAQRETLAREFSRHWIAKSLNLGQYRTEAECECGFKWIIDGHQPREFDPWHDHLADVALAHLAERCTDPRSAIEDAASDPERAVLGAFLSGSVVPSHTDFEAALWGACTAMLMLRERARAGDVEAITTEVEYLARTVASRYKSAGRRGERPDPQWLDTLMAQARTRILAALTPTRSLSAETHTEWGVRIEGRQEVVSAHHDSREKAERGAATWVAQGDGRTAQIVRREVTDWREVRDAD